MWAAAMLPQFICSGHGYSDLGPCSLFSTIRVSGAVPCQWAGRRDTLQASLKAGFTLRCVMEEYVG